MPKNEYFVRAAAIKALGNLGDDRAIIPLYDMLYDRHYRRQAVEALGNLGNIQAVG